MNSFAFGAFEISTLDQVPNAPENEGKLYCPTCKLIIDPKRLSNLPNAALNHTLSRSHFTTGEMERLRNLPVYGQIRANEEPETKLHHRKFTMHEIVQTTLHVLSNRIAFNNVNHFGRISAKYVTQRPISGQTLIKVGLPHIYKGSYFTFVLAVSNY